MRISALKYGLIRPSFLARLIVVAAFMLPVVLVSTDSISAETELSDPVQVKCLEVAEAKKSKGAIASCSGVDSSGVNESVRKARNTASWHCRQQSTEDNSMNKCIAKKANELLAQAITTKPIPQSEAGFEARLSRILESDADSTNGNVGAPAPEANTGQSADVYCAPGVECTQNSQNDPALCAAAQRNGVNLKGCATDANAKCEADSSNGGCDLIKKYVNPTIQLLSIVFGLIAVISLILGGIQYSAAAGDSQKITNAKKRISLTLIAIVAYAFLYGALDFLIPGGLFNRDI
jgi:hypothetical protein